MVWVFYVFVGLRDIFRAVTLCFPVMAGLGRQSATMSFVIELSPVGVF